VAELAARIRDAESEVKKLVEGYTGDEDEGEEDHHVHSHAHSSRTDLERNGHGMDEGSDDDGESDGQSLDALDERWNELEVSLLRLSLSLVEHAITGNSRYLSS
jgi:hypothetical protein